MSLGNVFHPVGCAISTEQADISLKYLDWKKDYDVISCISFPGCVLKSSPDLIPNQNIFDISLNSQTFWGRFKRAKSHLCYGLNWAVTPLPDLNNPISCFLCNCRLRDVERIIQVLIKGDLMLVEQAGNQELICIAVALPWLPAPQIIAAN